MKTVRIKLHEDKTSQVWYGTNKDSQISVSEGFYNISKLFNLYTKNKFTGGKYFELGNNGGSYSLNFNRKDLRKITKVLKENGWKITFEAINPDSCINATMKITQALYLKQERTNDIDNKSVLIANTMLSMGM